MFEELDARLSRLARRAGLRGTPPGAAVVVVALGAVAVVAALWRWWPGRIDHEVSTGRSGITVTRTARTGTTSSAAPAAVGEAGTGASSAATICVYVVGAVRRPGLYTLASGARVAAVVEDAGGLRPDAAREAVNLAAELQDGQELVVPTHRQVSAGTIPDSPSALSAQAPSGASPTANGAARGMSAKVDINSADATQLDSLPGVGPSTAAKIVADRQANGPFKSTDDLGRVSGIGPKKLAQLKPLIVVR